jgi:hypothetical protein
MRSRTVLFRGPAVGVAVVALAAPASASVPPPSPLFSNGPIITNPTGGTGSIAGLPISNADGFNFPGNPFLFSTTGVGATISANTAVAENFTVPASGWDLDTLTVYAFQTGQTSASVTQIQVNLWNATPFSATSPGAPPVIPQPVLSLPLTLAAGPGTFVAHRQSPTGTSTVRPVFSYTVSLDGLPNAGVLPQGEYWIQWSFLGASSPSANVFTPLVSPRTAAVDLNARLLNSIDGSAAGPRIWFEGREGFVAGQSEGRAYALPFELGGSVIPAPGSLAVLSLAALGVARRRR